MGSLFYHSRIKRAAVLVQCGNGRTDELTFEQPEEIALFAKVKPDGTAVIRIRAGRIFCTKESGTAGKFYPVFRFFERRDFFIASLV